LFAWFLVIPGVLIAAFACIGRDRNFAEARSDT